MAKLLTIDRRGQRVSRQMKPMSSPATPPTTANKGMMRMAQIQPSMSSSIVPVTNSAPESIGAKR
jgi:hypothetical protein